VDAAAYWPLSKDQRQYSNQTEGGGAAESNPEEDVVLLRQPPEDCQHAPWFNELSRRQDKHNTWI